MIRHRGTHGLALACLLAWYPVTGHAQTRPASLADAVQMALAIHPSLKAESARTAAAEEAIAEARGSLLPQARLDASGTRFQEPMVVAPLHRFNPQAPPTFDRTLIQLQASLGMTLFDGGLRRAGIAGAQAQASASAAQLEATREAVISEVADAWLDAAASRELLTAEESRIGALEAERDRVRQLVEVGRAAPLESLRVEAALQGAMADRIKAAQAVNVAEQSLARLIGIAADRMALVAIAPLQVREPLAPAVEWHRRARESSPEVAAAESRVAAAEATARAAGSSWWPELRLVGGYTDYWSGAGRLQGEWQAGLRAGFPVFTGGSRRAAGQRTALDVTASTAARDAVIQRLDTAVDQAIAAATSASARSSALAAAVAQYQEVVRIEQLALDAGAGTRRDWITAMADLITARAGLIEARQAQASARITLARITGQLTPAFLTNLLENQP